MPSETVPVDASDSCTVPRRLVGHVVVPYLLLAVVVLGSLGLGALRLEQPCDGPCDTAASYSLIFDEFYYVNAARRIAGVPSAPEPAAYATAPAGTDPNAEHPQLGKLAMAAGIAVLGDRPLGYRLGSLVAGAVALVLLFVVVRSAGGGPWLALAATSVLATENLFGVHARIATLDVYVLVFVLGGIVLYLRRHPIPAGIVLGLGATTKLVGIYALFLVGLFELFRYLVARRRTTAEEPGPRRLEPVALCIVATLVTYGVVLQVLDMTVPAFDPGTGALYTDAWTHTRHMLDYAVRVTGTGGGIASPPWEWLVGLGAIPYLTVEGTTTVNGEVVARTTEIAFRGEINPALLFVAIPALFAAAARAWRDRSDLDCLAVAWFLGFVMPFTAQALAQGRTTYVYYLLVVVPALCIAAVRLWASPGLPRAAVVGWAVALIAGFAVLYPFR